MIKCLFISALLLIGQLSAALEEKIIEVSGASSVQVAATLAEIHFSLEVEDKKSTLVQNSLAERINQLMEALKKEALHLNSSAFSIFPEYTKQNPPEIGGYRGRGEVVIEIPIERAGQTIALALESGATGINHIQLKATEKEQADALDLALKKALDNALRSAQTALSHLQLQLKEIETININNPQPMPYRASAFALEKSAGPALEGEQTVQANVSMKLRFRSTNE